MNHFSQTLFCSAIVLSASAVSAQTWTPLSAAGKSRSIEVLKSSVFAIPPALFAKGGNLRVLLVGAGEGGSASSAKCDEQAIQGGKGGDGGEAFELDIPLAAGQCSAGLTIGVGERGRGALRGGNGSALGESGGQTTVSCAGQVVALALGGGRRPDAVTAPRAAKGGSGGAILNSLESISNEAFDQRSMNVVTGGEGQTGLFGYGSGGGGGGVSLSTSGVSVRVDGGATRRAVVRNAPLGKGGYGAGAGAGAAGFAGDASTYPAENAIQYGAGGGGGFSSCGANGALSREAGHGASGLVKLSWTE